MDSGPGESSAIVGPLRPRAKQTPPNTHISAGFGNYSQGLRECKQPARELKPFPQEVSPLGESQGGSGLARGSDHLLPILISLMQFPSIKDKKRALWSSPSPPSQGPCLSGLPPRNHCGKLLVTVQGHLCAGRTWPAEPGLCLRGRFSMASPGLAPTGVPDADGECHPHRGAEAARQ